MDESYAVLIIEMSRYDPAEDYVISGFPTFEVAKEFARRRVRDSIEELRRPGQSKAELRRLWHSFGEDASVLQSAILGQRVSSLQMRVKLSSFCASFEP